MTRDEAKYWLELEWKTWEYECKSNHPIKEALSVAIKALEQEPCKDAVSRQSVLNTLDKRFDSIPVGETIEILLLRKDLRELPSVIPYKVESEVKK